MTTGSFPSMTATQLFVVPRSIPIIFPIYNEFNSSILFINDYAVRLPSAILAGKKGFYGLAASPRFQATIPAENGTHLSKMEETGIAVTF
jgi:hypothetical protein